MSRPTQIKTKHHEREWHQGSVTEVRPGVWRAWRERVRSADGTTTRPSRTFKGENAESRAKTWAQGAVEPAVLLLGHWLDRWLALREPSISPGTRVVYRRAVDACAPLIGKPLADVTTEDFQGLANALLERWTRESVKVWRAIIGSAMRAAVPRHLTVDPLARVRLPKRDEQPPKAWRQDEVDRLLGAAVGGRHEAWLVFSLGTGVRLGEARALRWEDVDLVAMTATIRASLDNKTAERGPTKTRKVRVIDIPDEVKPFLSEHAKRQRPGTVLVFGKAGEEPYGVNTLRGFLTRCCREAKVRELPPHSLRHTYASLAFDDGVPVQDIAHQLGHSVKTCQTIYAHFIGQGLRRAARAIGKALRHRFSGPRRAKGTRNGTQTAR